MFKNNSNESKGIVSVGEGWELSFYRVAREDLLRSYLVNKNLCKGPRHEDTGQGRAAEDHSLRGDWAVLRIWSVNMLENLRNCKVASVAKAEWKRGRVVGDDVREIEWLCRDGLITKGLVRFRLFRKLESCQGCCWCSDLIPLTGQYIYFWQLWVSHTHPPALNLTSGSWQTMTNCRCVQKVGSSLWDTSELPRGSGWSRFPAEIWSLLSFSPVSHPACLLLSCSPESTPLINHLPSNSCFKLVSRNSI